MWINWRRFRWPFCEKFFGHSSHENLLSTLTNGCICKFGDKLLFFIEFSAISRRWKFTPQWVFKWLFLSSSVRSYLQHKKQLNCLSREWKYLLTFVNISNFLNSIPLLLLKPKWFISVWSCWCCFNFEWLEKAFKQQVQLNFRTNTNPFVHFYLVFTSKTAKLPPLFHTNFFL